MKCAAINCQRPAARGMKYCSRDCAPLGRYGINTNSEKTERSISMEGGSPSKRPSYAEIAELRARKKDSPQIESTEIGEKNMREKDDCAASQLSVPLKEIAEIKTAPLEQNLIQEKMKSSESGTGVQEKNHLKKSTPTETSVIRQGSLDEQMQILAAEQLNSLSIVDESIKLLSGQMKRICLKPEWNEEKLYIDPTIEPKRASVAAQTGAVITKMLRLKLDAAKIAMKLSEKK